MSEPFCACDWTDECDEECICVCHRGERAANTDDLSILLDRQLTGYGFDGWGVLRLDFDGSLSLRIDTDDSAGMELVIEVSE